MLDRSLTVPLSQLIPPPVRTLLPPTTFLATVELVRINDFTFALIPPPRAEAEPVLGARARAEFEARVEFTMVEE